MNLSKMCTVIDNMAQAMATLSLSGEFGSIAGKRLGLCYGLTAIKNNLAAALRYTLPRSTFKQRWNDCFGWAICLR